MPNKWFSAAIIALVLVVTGISQLPSKAYAQEPQSQCWAVLVGVSNYLHQTQLSYPDDGARELSQLLSPAWGQDHVKLLLDSEANKNGIIAAIEWLAKKDSANDTVLFYFCGHGGLVGIAPYDSYYDGTNLISSYELDRQLDNLSSTRVVVILDTCDAGGFKGSLGDNGRVALLSSRAYEYSLESFELESGVFTYYILQALDEFADANQDYELSAEEVFQYAEPETTSYVDGLQIWGITQHPVILDGYSGELGLLVKFVFEVNPDIPAGTQILTVDNQPYSAGSPSLLCAPGSTHNIEVSSPVDAGKGTRYVFTSWGDGDTSTSRTSSGGGIYEIEFKKEYQLTIESEYGEPQGAGWYEAGSTANISAASVEEATIRHVFTGWSGDYTGTGATASIIMDSPKTITANWQTEYLLTIESEYAKTEGAGWYRPGETANISTPSSTGIIIRHFFTGWSGDYTGTGTTESVTMDLPKTIIANWRTDYTQLYILIGGVVVLAVAAAVVILWVRRRRAVVPVAQMEVAIPVKERESFIPPAVEPAIVAPSVTKARLTLPDGSEIQLPGEIRLIRQVDFEKVVSAEALGYISRQQLLISYDNGRYFIEDLDSTNGTKLNGVEIKGRGKQELNDGDRIEVAGVAGLIFKT